MLSLWCRVLALRIRLRWPGFLAIEGVFRLCRAPSVDIRPFSLLYVDTEMNFWKFLTFSIAVFWNHTVFDRTNDFQPWNNLLVTTSIWRARLMSACKSFTIEHILSIKSGSFNASQYVENGIQWLPVVIVLVQWNPIGENFGLVQLGAMFSNVFDRERTFNSNSTESLAFTRPLQQYVADCGWKALLPCFQHCFFFTRLH